MLKYLNSYPELSEYIYRHKNEYFDNCALYRELNKRITFYGLQSCITEIQKIQAVFKSYIIAMQHIAKPFDKTMHTKIIYNIVGIIEITKPYKTQTFVGIRNEAFINRVYLSNSFYRETFLEITDYIEIRVHVYCQKIECTLFSL